MSLATPVDAERVDAVDRKSYRLLSIESARAPEGCAGRDWFVYRIARGVDEITGYRCGDGEKVRTDVETIVAGFNGRRSWAKGESRSKRQRRARTVIPLGSVE